MALPPCLPGCSFAWGPAAATLQQLPQAAAAGEQQQRQRQLLLQQRLPLDPARAALTACHWPEACSLAVPGSSSTGASSDGEGSTSTDGLAALPAAAAAFDPGFLLPFCCCCLRQRLLTPHTFAEAGLLSGEVARACFGVRRHSGL
jgi:hypothetical protein